MASKLILEMKAELAKGRRNWESVIELNKKILPFDTKNSFVYYDIAEGFRQLGDTSASLEYAKRAVEINPKDFFSLRLMALIYDQLDDYDKTYEYAKRSLENLPKNVSQPPRKLYKALKLFAFIPIIEKLNNNLYKEINNWGSWRKDWSDWATRYISWYENHRPTAQ